MNATKIHPLLLDELTLATRALADDGVRDADPEMPIIVRMRPTRSLGAMSVPEGAAGFQVERQIPLVSAVTGTATRSQIEALSESDEVEIIWLDEPVFAILDSSVALVEAPAIWATGNEGGGVRIAILDTGVDAQHPDFAGRLLAAQDFTGEGPNDGHGHGTHVASIAAGSGAASNGQYRGVAPRATLLSAKVLRNDGNGRMSLVMAGVEWAVEQGAQVINLSLGSRGNGDGTDATSATCDAATDAGVVVIAAVGNEGPGSGTVGAPGCARKVITVGAATDGGAIASFSSRGPTTDGRAKPDVVLPGVGIVAARSSGTTLGSPLDERYTRMDGSSMAAPHAAGIAALMLAIAPRLTPADVKRLMGEAARSLGVEENLQGKGMVFATRAVELARQTIAPAPLPEPQPVVNPQPDPLPPPPPAPAPQPEGCFAPVAKLFGRR